MKYFICIWTAPDGIFYTRGGSDYIKSHYKSLSDAVSELMEEYFTIVYIDHCSQRALIELRQD